MNLVSVIEATLDTHKTLLLFDTEEKIMPSA